MRGKLIIAMMSWGMAVAVSGCGNLVELPGSGPAPQIYSLSVPDMGNDQTARPWRLLIDEPDASRALDIDRVAMWTSPVEVSYLKDARWSDRVPRLIQGLLIEAFDRAGSLELVARGSVGRNAPYMLTGHVQDFQAEAGGRPRAHVRLKLIVVEQASARILASRVFEAEVKARSAGAKQVVLAFNEAMATLLPEIVTWAFAVVDDERQAVQSSEREQEVPGGDEESAAQPATGEGDSPEGEAAQISASDTDS